MNNSINLVYAWLHEVIAEHDQEFAQHQPQMFYWQAMLKHKQKNSPNLLLTHLQ